MTTSGGWQWLVVALGPAILAVWVAYVGVPVARRLRASSLSDEARRKRMLHLIVLMAVSIAIDVVSTVYLCRNELSVVLYYVIVCGTVMVVGIDVENIKRLLSQP